MNRDPSDKAAQLPPRGTDHATVKKSNQTFFRVFDPFCYDSSPKPYLREQSTSGVEIVGFVLAALPLAISAVEHYHDELDPLRDYLRYTSTLKSLRTRLRIQQDLFEGTMKRLLLEELSSPQAQALFPDDGQHADREQWNTPEIKKKLLIRLGGKYQNFMDVVCEMETAMRRLMKNLDIDIDERPS